MQGADQLLAIAEVGAALAGFTGVIGALGMRDAKALSEAKRLQVWLMLEFSLGTVFFSLLPFAPANFGATETTVWSISSGLMALFVLGHIHTMRPKIRLLMRREEWINGIVAHITGGTILLMLLVQAANATGLLFAQSYGPYYLGLLLFVVLAAGNFISLMSVIWARD